MLVLLPLFLFTVVIALGSAGIIGGYLFSLKSLAPKLSKVSPLQGFKRMFGLKAVVDLIKALTKFSLVGLVLYLVVSQSFSAITHLGFMSVEPAMASAGEMIAKGTILVTLTLIIAAAIDIPYQIHEFNKKIRMTKQEVKDELKDTEGRPEVKAQIRRKQREMALGSMLEAVAEADVVIVNPEHFAVALSYDPSSDSAPILVAKGVDFIAENIKQKAGESGVTVFSSPSLARALYFTTEINQSVPEALYHAVAQVIAYVFSLNGLKPGAKASTKPDPQVPAGMRYNADGTLIDK
jgi:flagellar biosynthetic protein FlhB